MLADGSGRDGPSIPARRPHDAKAPCGTFQDARAGPCSSATATRQWPLMCICCHLHVVSSWPAFTIFSATGSIPGLGSPCPTRPIFLDPPDFRPSWGFYSDDITPMGANIAPTKKRDKVVSLTPTAPAARRQRARTTPPFRRPPWRADRFPHRPPLSVNRGGSCRKAWGRYGGDICKKATFCRILSDVAKG